MKPGNILIVIVITLLLTPLLIHSNSHGWGGDFSLYIAQAQALWEGNTQQVLEQNSFGLKHSSYSYYSPELYPWGWPLLLSPVIKFVGLNFIVLKMVVLFFFIGTVISVYYLFRYKAGSTGSLLIAAYIAFNPGLIEYTNVLRSAFPFLFFTMLSFIMYESMNKSKDVGWSKIIPAAFFFFFASIIRSEGFLLVVAVGIAEFIKWGFQKYSKKYLANRMWLFKMAAVFILFYAAYVMILPGGTASNFEHFKLTTVDTASGNISFYFSHLDYCFSSFLKQSFVMVMLPFVLLGLYSRFRDDMAIAVYFVLLHFLFIIWPHHEIRYLFIIAPFYFYFLFQGIKKIDFSIFVKKLEEGYELVMGNRFKGGIEKGAMPFLHRYLGNPVLSFVGRLFFKSSIEDFHCGLRAFRKSAYNKLELKSTGMEFASEMVVKATMHKLKIAEVPTTLAKDGRTRAPHLNTWRDGWRHLRFLFLYAPNWLILFPGLFLFIVGTTLGIALLFKPIVISNVILDIHTLLYMMAFAIVGSQMLILYAIVKNYSVKNNIIPANELINKHWLYRITLEKGVIAGVLLFISGFIISFTNYLNWSELNFGELNPIITMRKVIPSVFLLSIGIQLIIGSFVYTLINTGK